MHRTFDYKVEFEDGTKEIIEFECSFSKGGFDYPGYGGGFKSEIEIDNVEFDEAGLSKEQIKYINEYVIDSNAFIDKCWESFDNY